jgi:drug/metabolite transporter (DMT)-like permease
MSIGNILLLLALSGIWGSSFIFMRYLAPLLGPLVTADARVLIAGAALAVFFALIRFKPEWRRNGKHFLVIGLVNSGIPFLLYSFAALYLPASFEAILNSLAPMFGAVFSAIWLSERITLRKGAGLLLGTAGVVLVSSLTGFERSPLGFAAVAACILAPACYGLAGVYIKKRASSVKPLATAGGSQLAAGLVLLPFAFVFPPPAPVTAAVAGLAVGFALLCSALAYIIYYRLIAEVGPTRALTVTFLIPVFAMVWGLAFLGERVTPIMIGGAAVILAGTYLVAAPRRQGARAERPKGLTPPSRSA